jgi:hypothetical protein
MAADISGDFFSSLDAAFRKQRKRANAARRIRFALQFTVLAAVQAQKAIRR